MRRQNGRRLYLRSLPGGGYVAIDVARTRVLLGGQRYEAELIVERRAETSRRRVHCAPVVAIARGRDVDSVMRELFPIAQSNAELAFQCLCHDRQVRKRHDSTSDVSFLPR